MPGDSARIASDHMTAWPKLQRHDRVRLRCDPKQLGNVDVEDLSIARSTYGLAVRIDQAAKFAQGSPFLRLCTTRLRIQPLNRVDEFPPEIDRKTSSK
ncbi:MAG: hypothetical protein ACOYD0_02585 [Candidatus Nanopelagicales bacterium]